MYPVSDLYTKLMNDESSVLEVLVEVDFGDGAVVLSGDQVEYIDFNERVNDNSNILTFGCACAHSVTIKLREPPELQYKGMKCKPRTGLRYVDGTEEWVPLGVYWVDGAKTNDDYRTVIVTGFDRMCKLDRLPFSQPATEVAGEYKVSFEGYVQAFEAAAGVAVARPEGGFPDYYITNKIEDGEYNCRDIAGHLAGCLGRNATFNREGELEFIFYTPTPVKAFVDLQYMNGFEKLADNALKIDFLVTGKDGDIELENNDPDDPDPGAIDWSDIDAPEVETCILLSFGLNDETMTASVALDESSNPGDETVVIPPKVRSGGKVYTVTSVASYGFSGSTIKAVEFPDTMQSIGSYAFYNCHELESAPFPSSLTSLDSDCFRSCSSLKSINIDRITYMGANVFTGCDSLTYVEVPAGINWSDWLGYGTTSPFSECKNLVTVVTRCPEIRHGMFRDCTSLKNVYLYNTTTIQNGAFRGCTALEHIVIPDTVQKMSANLGFADCTSLKTVQIGTSIACQISSMRSNLFENCPALETISIYKLVDTIGGAPWGATNATVSWLLYDEEAE